VCYFQVFRARESSNNASTFSTGAPVECQCCEGFSTARVSRLCRYCLQLYCEMSSPSMMPGFNLVDSQLVHLLNRCRCACRGEH
jgi:hypothetical protein